MQSSVRSEPPHLGDILRAFSNDSVHINKEVSITSSRVPTPIQKASISSMPPIHIRPQTARVSSMPYGGSAAPVSRWNSMSKSEKSSLFQFQMRPGTGRRPSSVDPDLLESNRESMKALSDFLMTREPPPNNWMSIQSSDDDKSLHSLKRSAYNLFGKGKKKKSKTPRLMRLPDSAVAARTREGARHIAISIPIEHDHMEPTRPRTPMAAIRQQRRSGDRERTDRTVVHVMKPVTESRESVSSYLTSPPRSRNGPVVVEPVQKSPINPLAFHPPGDFRPQSPTLGQNAGTYLNYKPEPRIEPRNANPKTPHKSYVAVSPTAVQRQDSKPSDQRHSGGTLYSAISTAATPHAGHSRQESSVSTAPSAIATGATGATIMPSLKLNLPLRNSSISKLPKSIQEELAQSSKLANEKAALEPPNSPTKQGSTDSYSPSPPLAIVETAQPAKKYSGLGVDGIQVVRSPTPRSQISPPPNKSLPDLPRTMSRPNTAPPSQSGMRFTAVSQLKDSTARRTASTRDGNLVGGKVDPAFEKRQSRQERVKERKQRDIEALRSNSKLTPRAPLSESNNRETASSSTGIGPGPVRSSRITTPPRNPKRNGPSSAEKRRMANSVSPIMLVANLLPYTGHVSIEDLHLSSLHSRRGPKNTDSQSTIRALRNSTRERTPPLSPTTLDSFPRVPTSTSTSPQNQQYAFPLSNHSRSPSLSSTGSSTPRRSNRSRTQSLRSSVLETRRQERRAKRNLSLREQELDARMRKIERDNAVLLQTLGGIARSFGQLHRVTGQRGRNLRREFEGFREEERGREERRLGFGEGMGEMGYREVGREGRGESKGEVRGVDEGARRGELRSIEPVMRELQGLAPRVSTESRVLEGEGFEDEEDGRSVLRG
ncbi:hypothetical protein BDZ45DRAFT_782765 [Acephala macrosclerotiorum]|nr:hypothetical protein BDZ45DRAFT_782765 [Acephala macrosclerotiorum]